MAKIFVPVQLNNIVECKFEDIELYLGISKAALKLGTDIAFEMVRDLGEPTN